MVHPTKSITLHSKYVCERTSFIASTYIFRPVVHLTAGSSRVFVSLRCVANNDFLSYKEFGMAYTASDTAFAQPLQTQLLLHLKLHKERHGSVVVLIRRDAAGLIYFV